MRHLQLPVPVTGELWLWGAVRGPSLHGGELTGDKTKVPDPFPPATSTPSLPLTFKVPGQFVGWLSAGPRMIYSAVAELDQLLRRKDDACHIPQFGRKMGYIGETETAELAVVCSWVLRGPAGAGSKVHR